MSTAELPLDCRGNLIDHDGEQGHPTMGTQASEWDTMITMMHILRFHQ